MRIFITGIAGFIGYHTAKRYIADGHEVVGLDNLNSSYSADLKSDRIQNLYELGMSKKNFKLGDINLTDINGMLLDVDLIFQSLCCLKSFIFWHFSSRSRRFRKFVFLLGSDSAKL